MIAFDGGDATPIINANGNALTTIDPWGFATQTAYDELNHPISVTNPDGGEEFFDFTAAGKPTTHRDALGSESTQLYDALGRLVEEVDPRGRSTKHLYDPNDNETQTIRTWLPRVAGGVRDDKYYDAMDRLVHEVRAASDAGAQQYIEYEYDAVGNLVREEKPDDRVTRTTYDERNRPVVVRDALDQRTVNRYDGVGNLRFVTNRRGLTTEFLYDELNRKVREVLPRISATGMQVVKIYGYDEVGNLVYENNPRDEGNEDAGAHHVYDGLNRLVSTSKRADLGDAPIRIVFNEYDIAGFSGERRDRVTDANGNTIETRYDWRGQVARVTQTSVGSAGESSQIEYDLAGRKTATIDELGNTTSFAYFEDGTVASATNAENETTSFEYDLHKNKIEEVRPSGNNHVTRYAFDARSRLVSVTNAVGGVTTFEYDRNDNLLHQRTPAANDMANKTSHVEYVYDVLNRKTRHIQHKSAGNLVTEMRYDAEGNLVGLTDPKAQGFVIAYDELSRETLRTLPDQASEFITTLSIETFYDANSNITRVVEYKRGDPDGGTSSSLFTDETTRTYDLFDREVASTQRGRTIEYAYDANGNRTRVASTGGSTVYTFDYRNRIQTATLNSDEPTIYTYLNNNWLARVAYPNGTEVATDYDRVGRPVHVTNRAGSSVISQFDYEYDQNGNRTQQIETQNGFVSEQGETTTYAFDRADRLTSTSVVSQNGDTRLSEFSYYASYDRRTERETTTVSGITATTKDRTYTYDETHWLTHIVDHRANNAPITYAYDANGNTLAKQDNTKATPEITSFDYDANNKLVKTAFRLASDTATTTLGRYDYNAAGLRIRHLDSERGDITYVYDDKAILDERNESGALVAHYNYADRLISLKNQTTTQFYHYQALRTTANLTNDSGAIQVSYRTDAWGHITKQEGASENRQVFTGQEHDEKTGLIYFGARFYDPDTARFTTQDSYLGEPGTPPSLHRYLYAYSNPTVYVDLYGYQSEDENFLQVAKDYWFGRDPEPVVPPTWNPKETGESFSEYEARVAEQERHLAQAENGEKVGGKLGEIKEKAGELYSTYVGEPIADLHRGSAELTRERQEGPLHQRDTLADLTKPECGFLCPDAEEQAQKWEQGDPATVISAVTTVLPVVGKAVDKVDDAVDAGKNLKRGAKSLEAVGEALPNDVLRRIERNLTDSGVAVLGAHPGYIKKAQREGASYFDIEEAWDALGDDAKRWNANRYFLDVIAGKGDQVKVSIPKSKIRNDSWLAREIEYLTKERGYVWVNQYSLKPGN